MMACGAPAHYTNTSSQQQEQTDQKSGSQTLNPQQRCLEEVFKSYHPQKGDASVDKEACRDVNPSYLPCIDHVSSALQHNYQFEKDLANASDDLVSSADLAQKTADLIQVTRGQAEQFEILYPNSSFEYAKQLDAVHEIAEALIKTSKHAAATIMVNENLYTQLLQAYTTSHLTQPVVESIELKITQSQEALEALLLNKDTTQELAWTVITYKKALDKDLALRKRNGGILPHEML